MQAVKYFIKKNFSSWIYRFQKAGARKTDLEKWFKGLPAKPLNKLSEASYDIFTYHGEDGILFYLLQTCKNIPNSFVDIGAGDCIKSNCAILAVHLGWPGVFIDMNKKQLEIGSNFYKKQVREGARLQFVEAAVTPENINNLLQQNITGKETGIMSIDIDGNDYWIWKAIEIIQPAIVIIEAKVEFGNKRLVVPYGEKNHPTADSMYNGASAEALRILGKEKGYKLAGANKQGYNLFFVKDKYQVPEVTSASLLDDPAIIRSFYPESFFETHQFEKI